MLRRGLQGGAAAQEQGGAADARHGGGDHEGAWRAGASNAVRACDGWLLVRWQAFGARGGPANAKLRERLRRQGDVGGGAGRTDASFAATLQGRYRPQGAVSCEDTHQLLKEREAAEHEALMRDAKVAAAATVDRIDARVKALELSEARERAAGAAEARASADARSAGEAEASAADAVTAALKAECLSSGGAGPGPPAAPLMAALSTHSVPHRVASGVVDPDPPQSREVGGLNPEGESRRQETADDGRVALRSLAKELWRSFNKELAHSGPPRMPPRLRLPPPGWSAKDLENLEVRILEAGGVPIRRLAAFSFQSSAAICGQKRGSASPQKEICAICLGNLDQAAGAGSGLRLESGGPRWLRELPCGHCFHPSCVCDWLLCEHKCPMCRLDLREGD